MIYISVDRLPAIVSPGDNYPVTVIIKDYSGKGLVPESLKLMWRLSDEKEWRGVALMKSDFDDQYLASIDGGHLNSTIEYFIVAESKSGKKESMPRTAPKGLYKFMVSENLRE